ncbi:MAG: 1-(5-phosphoribosyl)-5-[(5-phosphoribosylamino)methylideneamino] imidazole-4-carboxamide isomerase [Gammaproteobacteria bacterium]|nr:1-(5-phosphoribosyl)-5-[(5-phosphoribosylamino)methylideneamino] imidazole-4-carboxamide isomerase [Gammaproteobacteria bacterium]
MKLIPAIDIYQGQCVRLLQGRFDQVTFFDVDPDTLAKRYSIAGADWMHLVNLDGAKDGESLDFDQLRTLSQINRLKIQCGGGFRNQETVQRALQIGVSRVVLGSLVLTAPETVKDCVRDYGAEHITLALDVRIENELPLVASHGWERQSTTSLWQVLDDFSRIGITDVLCTDISRDGAMGGPNLSLYRECTQRFPDIAWQASGGVRSIADLHALSDTGVAAAIVGRALYQNEKLLEEARPYLQNA